jgi:hypothetical protein
VNTPRTTDTLLGKCGKRNQKVDWSGLKQVQESSFHTGRQIRKTGDDKKKKLPDILCIPGPNIRRPKTVDHGKGKEAAPNLSAVDGTENTASCMQKYNDEW